MRGFAIWLRCLNLEFHMNLVIEITGYFFARADSACKQNSISVINYVLCWFALVLHCINFRSFSIRRYCP